MYCNVFMHACLYVCMCVCIHVCMYVGLFECGDEMCLVKQWGGVRGPLSKIIHRQAGAKSVFN